MPEEKKPRVRVTIVHEFDLDRYNYRYGQPDTDRALSDEEVNALTPQAMLEAEQQYLKEHTTCIEDVLADWDPTTDETDTIKWELVEDASAD
jgi:hypothetical protein